MGDETTILWALLRGLDVGNDRPSRPRTSLQPSCWTAWLGHRQPTGSEPARYTVDCDEVDQDSWGSRPWHSGVVHSRLPGDRIGTAIMLLHVSGPTRHAQIVSNVIRGGRRCVVTQSSAPFTTRNPPWGQRNNKLLLGGNRDRFIGASSPIAGHFTSGPNSSIYLPCRARPSVSVRAPIGRLDAGSNCDLDKSPCQAGVWG